MATKAGLRAVRPGEAAPPTPPAGRARPKTVAQAAKSGTPRELLVAMRDLVAETLIKPNCPPREFAALTKRLQDIVKDIEILDARDDGDQLRRLRELEAALRVVEPDHPLLLGGDDLDGSFDASAL